MTPDKIMEVQFFFQRRLKEHGVTIYFYGLTDIPSRWEQIRAAIIGSQFDSVAMGKTADGKPETYAQSFERAFGAPLQPKQEAAA
jgi:hypothetical protein